MAPRRKRKNSSSEEESSVSSSSEEELDSSSSEEEEEEEILPKKKKPVGRRPAAKKPAAAAASRKKKAKKGSSSEEEAELGDSQQPDEDDPGYGSDLIVDDKDRAYLNSIQEVEREKILSERYEKLLKWNEIKRLRGITSSTTKSTASKQKVRIESDSDEGTTSKQKQQQQQRKQQQEKSSTPIVIKNETKKQDDGSSSSSLGESEEDEDVFKMEKTDDEEEDSDAPPPDTTPISLRNTNKILVTRTEILSWMDFPKFKTGLNGCLIKLKNDGGSAGGGEYVLKRIIKVVYGKDVEPYMVDKERVLCKLKVRGGPKNKSSFESVARVSNHEVTEHEFEEWRKYSPLVKLRNCDAEKILKHLNNNLRKFVFKPEQVLMKVEARKFRRGENSALTMGKFGLNLVGRKTAILQEIQDCNREKQKLALELQQFKKKDSEYDEDEDENDHLTRIGEELKEINEKLNLLEQELESAERSIASQAEKRLSKTVTSKLNDLNVETNRQTMLKSEQLKREIASKQLNEATLNPFLRKPTRPTMMWDTNLQRGTGTDDATTTTTTTTTADKNKSPSKKALMVKNLAQEESSLGNITTLPEIGTESVRPQQAHLKLAAGAPIAASTATKKFSLEEYRRMKQANKT